MGNTASTNQPADGKRAGPSAFAQRVRATMGPAANAARTKGEFATLTERRRADVRNDIALVCGYGLYQAVSSSGYLSAMGTVSENVGFVSQLPFMLAGCVFGALTAFAVALAAHRGRSGVGFAPFAAAYALLAACPLVSSLAVQAGMDGETLAALLGGVRGLCASVVSLAWICLLVLYARGNLALLYAATFGLKGALGLAFDALPASLSGAPASLVLLAASLACSLAVRPAPAPDSAAPEDTGRPHAATAHRARLAALDPSLVRPRMPGGRSAYAACLCLLVCEFVVGVANTAVFNSSFSSALAGVSMNACTLASVALVATLAFITRRTPDPSFVFKACMPVMLAVFSLMPFVTEQLGAASGYAMIVCYDTLALAFSAYAVTLMRDEGRNPAVNLGTFMGVSNLTLLLGLAVGTGMNALWNSQGVPLLTLLAFVAIYPIGVALLFVQRSAASGNDALQAQAAGGGPAADGKDEPAAAPSDEQVGELMKDYYAGRLADFAGTYGLTPREAQVCAHLVRGRSVKFVCQELSITENTAWTHIKNLYAKCGVGSKQELMDLFERDGARQG